ncbi:hypothetical protein [uncultured Peptoniphilus sp.]|uniref:hypothetical protein n=1 Tax=uncultured Peptoniphilus sp. TaxID=254354 RepID=UPI0028053809|nr:hypothetical protein [uncultured Peptoniphilus sp.]
MDKKIKNYIIYAVFIVLLFLSTLFKSFSTDVLWPKDQNYKGSFDGIIFSDPQDIAGLNVTRTIFKENNKDFVKYDISFLYEGDFGNLRILGNPVGQIFLPNKMNPVFSDVTLKGEYNKINNALFQDNLKLKDLYKKVPEHDFSAVSKVRVPLDKEVQEVKFSILYEPREINHGLKGNVAKNAVFVTNARVESFRDTTKQEKGIKNESKNFQESGYYVNSIEVINERQVKSISFESTLNSIVFIISIAAAILLIWLDRSKSQVPLLISMMLSVMTVSRFLDKGATAFGILFIWTITGYLVSLLSYAITNEGNKIRNNDFKRSIAWTLIFLLVNIVIFIIPRTF